MRKFKYILVPSFFLLISLLHAQNNNKDRFTINGSINGVDAGWIRMLPDDGGNTLDSAEIINGKFVLQGRFGMPERRLFNIFPGNWNFKGFVEKGDLTFAIDTAGAFYQGNKTGKWALIREIEETGSSLFDVYKKYNEETNARVVTSLLLSFRKQLKSTNDEELASRITYQFDPLLRSFNNYKRIWLENYSNQYPTSIAGVFLFNELYNSMSLDTTIDYWQTIKNKFSGLAKSSVYYQQLISTVENFGHIQTGNLAPDFTLLKPDKKKFTLSSTRGSYILIDFWASWCVPCRAAIPNWKKFYAANKYKTFNIVSLADDRNWQDWQKAIVVEQMPWIQVVDEYPDANKAGIIGLLFYHQTIPFYILLDKEGKVILSTGNESMMLKKIEEVLN